MCFYFVQLNAKRLITERKNTPRKGVAAHAKAHTKPMQIILLDQAVTRNVDMHLKSNILWHQSVIIFYMH